MRLWRRVRAHRHPPLPHRSLTPARPHLAAKENLRCYAEFHGVGVKGSKVEEILPYAWCHAVPRQDIRGRVCCARSQAQGRRGGLRGERRHDFPRGVGARLHDRHRPALAALPHRCLRAAASLGAVDAALQRHLDEFGETSDLGRAVWRLKFRAYGYMWSLAGELRDYIERVISFKTIHDPAEVARASAVVVPPEISNPPATPPVPPFPEHLHTWATAEMLNGYPHLHRIQYGYEPTAIKLGLVIKEQKILTGVVPDGSLKQGASLAQAAAISLYNAAAVTGDHLGGPMPISPALLSGGVAATFLTTINAIPPERVPEMRFFTAVASVRRPSSRHCTARHTLPCRARPHGPFRPGTTSIPSSSGSIRSSRPSPRPRAPRHKRSLARAPLAAPSSRTSSTSRRPRR